jgi:hypothetical protein
MTAMIYETVFHPKFIYQQHLGHAEVQLQSKPLNVIMDNVISLAKMVCRVTVNQYFSLFR